MSLLLPWQQAQWQQLQAAKEQNRIAHAMLFVGPQGVGKRYFAECFAKGLLCSEPLHNGESCGNCPSCRLLKAGNHPDLRALEPEEGGKAIRVDAVRDFIHSETLSSQFGGFKIQLVDPADAMNIASSNALLKTLEEPTPSSLIVLITAKPGELPATIRSRCRVIKFPTPATDVALKWLSERGDGDWDTLLSVAAGAPFKAIALAGDDLPKLRSDYLSELFSLLEGKQDPIKLAESWLKRDTDLIFQWLANIAVDLLRLSADISHQELFNPDARDRLTAMTRSRCPRHWHQFMQNVVSLRKSVTRQLNLQLQLETLLLDLSITADRHQGVH